MYDDTEFDVLCDLVAEGYAPVSEITFFTSPAVKRAMKDVPKVTKKEFVAAMQPCDIVVAFSAKKQFIKTKNAKFVAKMMATAQGSPYTSSKLVIDNNNVAGYGIQIIEKPEENKITVMPKNKFVSARPEMMLIRIPELTQAQKNKTISFVKRRIGLSYQGSDLFKTAWNRLVGRKLLPFLKDKPLNPEEVNAIQEPLFCSNMITLALISAGFKKKFNNKNPWDTWPRDFILADFTEKLYRIDYT